MKSQIVFLTVCFLLTACNQQGNNVDFGFGMAGYSTRFVKMDPHARQVIHDYLTDSYKRNCSAKKKHHPHSCTQSRPFMTGGSLPVGTDYQPLPQDIMDKIGFVPPGADLLQAGYNVYLVHHADKIIYDSVSLHPYWKESLRKD